MNIKDILFSLILALGVTWGIRYYFNPSENKIEEITNRSFVAPEMADMAEPLQLNVDFANAKLSDQEEKITKIDTDYGEWLFSDFGAAVKQVVYKEKIANKAEQIISLPDEGQTQAENLNFLVALSGSTPYVYKLIDESKNQEISTLTYQAETEAVTIKKQYIVNNKTYKLDINLTIEPKAHNNLKARLFIPSPIKTETKGIAGLSAIFYNDKNELDRKSLETIGRFGKISPTILGIESHYFVNTLCEDTNNFARRGYFKIENNNAFTVLESSNINEAQTWHLTFYCGPKEVKALASVNENLTGIITYGWFSFISKAILYVLNFFNGIFNSYGWSIVALTILISLLFWPFSPTASSKKNTDIQKKLQYIEQKYKHDPVALAQQKAEFLRKHGLSGLSTVFILVLQIPIFIALSKLLSNAFELYKTPFLWIPNLAESDPYYILPALGGIAIAINWVLQSTDFKQVVTYSILGLIIGSMFSNLSAGLLIYIVVNSFFTIFRTYVVKLFARR